MNSFVTFACLLAVAGLSHGSSLGGLGGLDGLGGLGSLGGLGGLNGLGGLVGLGGLGGPLIEPIIIKSVPIPIVKTISSPIISSPIIKTIAPIPLIKTVSPIGLGSINPLPLAYSGLGGYGLGGLGGLNGLGGIGLSKGLSWGPSISSWGKH